MQQLFIILAFIVIKIINENNQIPFLDVFLINNVETISTTVYRKVSNTDIYINWKSFAPNNWKRGTLKTLDVHMTYVPMIIILAVSYNT